MLEGKSVPAVAEQSSLTHVYGAFWELGNGYSSTVVLKNNDSQNAIAANIVIFSHTGQQEQTIPVQVGANAVSRVALADVIKAQNDWGAVQVEFASASPQVVAKVVLSNSAIGNSVELPLQGGYRYDTENALYTSWWLPDANSKGIVVLFNASAQALVVTPSVASGGAEQAGSKVTLLPFQSTQIALSQLLGDSNATRGAVILRYAGSPHALQPALLVQNQSTGFWFSANFNPKHSHIANQGTSWEFPDVRLLKSASSVAAGGSPLKAYALFSNSSGSTMAPQLTAYFGTDERGQKENLPLAPLAPLETRLVELSQYAGNNGLIAASVWHFSLGVSHPGEIGDLGITVFSLDPSDNWVLPSEGTVLPAGIVDASYWDRATKLCMEPRAQNSGSSAVLAQAVLYYPTSFGVGTYLLPVVQVPSKKSAVLGVQQSVESGTRDADGDLIPSGTNFGMLTLAAVDGGSPAINYTAVATACPVMEGCGVVPQVTTAIESDVDLHLVVPPPCTTPPAAPTITSVSPTGAPFTTDTQVTIEGTNLDDPDLTVFIDGGITANSLDCSSSTECTATFDTSGDTTVGSHSFYFGSDDGHSNSEAFTTGDKTPSISSISPQDWPANVTTTPITITGTGFGTNPKVTLSDPTLQWTLLSATDDGAQGGATITGSVYVPTCTANEAINVTVTSQGYTGSGFVASYPGQSPQSPNFGAAVDGLPATAPTISFHGSVLSGTGSAVVGQQIGLTGNVPSPQSSCVSSQSWTTPTGTPVAGFSVTGANQSNGSYTTLTNSTTNTFTFYWTSNGTLNTTYSYTLNDGNSAQVTATFTVTGFASGAPFTATPTATAVKVYNDGGAYWLECGNASTAYCIQFSATATPPSGGSSNASFQWVQLINSSTAKYRTTPSTANSVCLGSGATCPALDNVYPYPTGAGQPNSTNDSPGIELSVGGVTAFGEAAQTFTAKMFLLWDPAMLPYGQSGSCTPAHTTENGNTFTPTGSTCTGSIPVPVGYVVWGFGSDAINTSDQVNSTTWVGGCPAGSCGGPIPASPTVQKSSALFSWTQSTANQGGAGGANQ